jgi:hypothetical protein
MKKLIAVLFCLSLVGCTGIKQPPSICDNMESGQSVLCDLANRYDLRLETVGDVLLAVNLRVVGQIDGYGKQEALIFFNRLKDLINTAPISAEGLQKWVITKAVDIPELMIVSPYIVLLNVPDLLTPTDIQNLNWWIDLNLKMIEAIKEK